LGKRHPNKDILERLDDIEKNSKNLSIVILFYSLGIALLVGHYTSHNVLNIILGLLGLACFIFGGLFSYFKGIRL